MSLLDTIIKWINENPAATITAVIAVGGFVGNMIRNASQSKATGRLSELVTETATQQDKLNAVLKERLDETEARLKDVEEQLEDCLAGRPVAA